MTRMTSSVVGEAMVSMNAGSRAATCAKLKRSELRSSSMMPSAHAPSMTLFMCCTSGCGRTFGMTMTPCGSPAIHSTARQCDAAAPRRPARLRGRGHSPATASRRPPGGPRTKQRERWCVRCVPYIEIELEHLGFVHLRGLCAY